METRGSRLSLCRARSMGQSGRSLAALNTGAILQRDA